MEIFGNTRRRLAFAYALIMCLFLAIIIFVVHMAMNWSMFSEQAQELADAANGVAEAQVFYLQNPHAIVDENRYYKSVNDRLFFYIFDADKHLVRFERASFRLEPFVLDVIEDWKIDEGEIEVFQHTNESGRLSTIMMTSKRIIATTSTKTTEQILYVGKDVTVLYSGLRKATYAQVVLGVIAIVLSSVGGYFMAGRALMPIKEAYDRQRQFAADASHELRTPLAVLLASSEILLMGEALADPFLRQVATDMKSEVKKMSNLVSELLEIARSDNGRWELKMERVELSEVLSQVVRVMTPLAEKKGLDLLSDLSRREVICDEQRLKQLALILMDNAVKYTPTGAVGVKLTARGFAVWDSGIGIGAADKDKIFERFYRVEKSRTAEGNGLGLSIAMEIVKRHGWQIEVHSEEGQGSEFEVIMNKTTA